MFETFSATRRINIGGKINISVDVGSTVQYDDQSLKFLKDGVEIHYPEFRGAIRAGWFVKTTGQPTSVGEALAPKDPVRVGMSGMVVESDEKYVGKVAKHVPREDDTAVKRVPFNRTVQDSKDWEVVNNYKNRRSFKPSEVEDQGGVVVGRVLTPTTTTITPENMSSIRKALEAQGPAKVVPEHMATPVPQSRTASAPPVLQTREVGYPSANDLEPKPIRREVISEEEPRVVATLKKDVEPEWDRTLHWRSRAKILKEMGAKDRKTMERILATEVPSVVSLVRQSFPEFSSISP